MKHNKKKVISIARKIEQDRKVTPNEIEYILSFDKKNEDTRFISYLKKSAVPLALFAGFYFAVFPEAIDTLASQLPSWTNLPQHLLRGVDYLWNIIGDPVEKSNILYHIPNLILYSFGVVGIKKIIDAIDRRSWADRAREARKKLEGTIQNGTTRLNLARGHSVLFMGNGDFIGMQFVLDHKKDQTAIIAQTQPSYTNIWNYFDPNASYEDLEKVIERVAEKDTGEFIFFPVKDDQIFLPASHAYDLSPHKLDILCQDIRTIEKKNKWKAKRILIVGDRFHKSYVHSEDVKGKLPNTEDTISIESISTKYPNITVIDPTDIVLGEIIKIADGRTIAFRATEDGIKEYKNRFYKRLEMLGYKKHTSKKGILTIGYDLFEDQTEQQTLARTVDDYIPVVLSKSVHDALIRNGYKRSEFIYVPDLVLEYLTQETSEQ